MVIIIIKGHKIWYQVTYYAKTRQFYFNAFVRSREKYSGNDSFMSITIVYFNFFLFQFY